MNVAAATPKFLISDIFRSQNPIPSIPLNKLGNESATGGGCRGIDRFTEVHRQAVSTASPQRRRVWGGGIDVTKRGDPSRLSGRLFYFYGGGRRHPWPSRRQRCGRWRISAVGERPMAARKCRCLYWACRARAHMRGASHVQVLRPLVVAHRARRMCVVQQQRPQSAAAHHSGHAASRQHDGLQSVALLTGRRGLRAPTVSRPVRAVRPPVPAPAA